MILPRTGESAPFGLAVVGTDSIRPKPGVTVARIVEHEHCVRSRVHPFPVQVELVVALRPVDHCADNQRLRQMPLMGAPFTPFTTLRTSRDDVPGDAGHWKEIRSFAPKDFFGFARTSFCAPLQVVRIEYFGLVGAVFRNTTVHTPPGCPCKVATRNV